MSKIKIYIGEGNIKDYCNVSSFNDFKLLVNAKGLENIEIVRFGNSLQQEEEELPMDYNLTDCAVLLVEKGKGVKLPQCLVEVSKCKKDIIQILNHYTQSYKFNNYCGEITSLSKKD